ncbi:hypothetical protein HDV06_003038 [Boothiomyces sp. JEL0866]|nr:hypothetical protein HDV06_003038 [Boothiomyces sp. JEL0866]
MYVGQEESTGEDQLLFIPPEDDNLDITEIREKKEKGRPKRTGIFKDDKVLFALCSHNGISESQFLSNGSKISSIDMCHYNFPVITGLHHFPQIKSLCIVAQDIREIGGLEACPNLEQLWICETRITRISGLDTLVNLKKLFMYSNRIEKMEGLSELGQLELLSLSDNESATEPCISYVEAEYEKIASRLAKIGQYLDTQMLKANHRKNPNVPKLEMIKKTMNVVVETKNKYKSQLIERLESIKTQIIEQCNEAIRCLLLELETGGNVRFEDEQKGAQWVSHCEKQIKKFIKRVASKDSPKTIQIHRISKLHNRGSKLKFDEKAGNSSASEKYFCFQINSANQDIFSIAENGFSHPQSSGIIMTNYFECNIAELPKTRKNGLRKAIIVRTIGLHCQEVSIDEDLSKLNRYDYPGFDAVYQKVGHSDSKSSGEQSRKYLIFNTETVVAEYSVEFSLESDSDKGTTQLERLLLDIAFSNRISHANMPAIVQELSAKIKQTPASQQYKDMLNLEKLEKDYPEIKGVDDISKSVAEYQKFYQCGEVSKELLNFTGFHNIEFDTHIDRNKITRLTINHSNLSNFPYIPSLPNLELLNLSFNDIQIIPELCQLPRLRSLEMVANRCADFADIISLSKCSQNFESIDLRLTPVSKKFELKSFLIHKIKNISSINGKSISSEERALYIKLYATNWKLFFELNSSFQNQSFRPLSIRTLTGPESSSLEQNYFKIPQSVHEKFDPHLITTLELDNCQLLNLDGLPEQMDRLKWASFRNNFLRDITKLSRYSNLEELSVEKNEITSIDCLASLHNLTKLDASSNKISQVENASFKALMFLCLEKNSIKSLRPFAKISTLLELYVGDNLITHSFTTFPLKELPKLIILDLTLNAVCKVPNFRLFTIFHLNRLKILNGTGITAKDQTQAKEMYMGKLTIELLGEKIGHFNFKNITELDLRNCKIREIDCLAGGEFRSLRKLNFDNNLLVNIDCFTTLSGLRHLSLNNNKIERLLSVDQVASGKPDDVAKPYMKNLLPNLEELYLGYNNIARISDLGLHRMPQLKILYLQGNKIGRVDGLEQMTNLIELVLDKNQIKQIDPLSFLSLINLRELHIKENRLKTLANFDCLPNLQILFLTNNRIHEMSEIEKMKLPSILEISLASNAVCRKQLYRIGLVIRFPHIMGIDGKEVTNEERQRAHTFYLEQCLIREDPVSKIVSNSQNNNMMGSAINPKHTVKITSVVLDGLEMKLSANSGFGVGRP